MEASPVKRRLVAILAADVAGYSRMVAENEEATLRTLGVYRATIGDMTSEHGGRVFGTAGRVHQRRAGGARRGCHSAGAMAPQR